MKKNLCYLMLVIGMACSQAQNSSLAFHKNKASRERKSFVNLPLGRQSEIQLQSLDSIVSQHYDAASPESSHYIIGYDERGNTISQKNYDREGDSTYLTGYSTYTYNDQNQKISSLQLNYEGDSMVYGYSVDYLYDVVGNVILQTEYDVDKTGQRTEYNRKSYLLYTSGKVTTKVDSSYYSGAWHYNNITKYLYDAEGRTTSITEYSYRSDTLTPMYKQLFEYNAAGLLILEVDSSRWNADGVFKPSNKYNYSHDAYGNQTAHLYSHWNDTTKTWNIEDKSEIGFDYSVSMDYIVCDPEIKQSFKHKVTEVTYFIYKNDNWILYSKDTVYYNDFIVASLKDKLAEQSSLSYDETTKSLQLSSAASEKANIALYDLQGRIVCNQGINGQSVSLAHVSTGIYVYKLEHNGSTSQGRIFVK